jgi:carboxymethylenebutenolidase
MTTIDLDGASGFLVRAQHAKGGVLLLPTIYGVNAFAREYASSLAAAGLTTLIWDPYAGDALPASFEEARKRGTQLRDMPSLDAMAICVDHLLGELRLDAVGTIGFCLGGRYGLLLAARESRIGACVSVYPTISSPKGENQDEDAVVRAGEIQCPVQLVYPGKDHITTGETFHRLQDTLQNRDAATVVQLFPAAEHGFMHMAGAVNEAADRRARPVIGAFLQASLAPTK